MNDQKKQFLDVLDDSANILVTVRSNPDIDHLAACIALTLMLNELGKRATAVFSGKVPSVLDFLEPHKTLQTSTDSLQDFIISLDKAKADKLRYKVEEDTVKIFITPYKTALTKKDLHYEAGDFNVDMVIALGVHIQDDVDHAITTHGRILHDASVAVLNIEPSSADDIGNVHWTDETSGSLSEMITNAIDDLVGVQTEVLDGQIATALLTGIVAATNRFGNSKTKPSTMQAAGRLLAAGASQELVASHLAGNLPVSPLPSTGGPNALPPADKASEHGRGRSGSRSGRHAGRHDDNESFAARPARPHVAADLGSDEAASEQSADNDNKGSSETIDKPDGVAAETQSQAKAESDAKSSKTETAKPARKVAVVDADEGPRQSEHAVDALAISHSSGHDADGDESEQAYIMEDVKSPAATADTAEVQLHEDEKPEAVAHEAKADVDDLTVEELMGDGADGKVATTEPSAVKADTVASSADQVVAADALEASVDKPAEPSISDAKASSPDQTAAILADTAARTAAYEADQKSYDPNQISVPASIAATSAEVDAKDAPPVAEASAPATVPSGDEQLLSMLGTTPESTTSQPAGEPATAPEAPPADPIQPLRDQGGFVGEPPLQDKIAQAPKDSTAPVDSTLDPTKFAITPPSMGGTLTASQAPEAAATSAADALTADAPETTTNGLPLKNTSTFMEKKAQNEGEEGPSGGAAGGDQQLIHHGGKKVLAPLSDNVPAATSSTPGSGAANVAPGGNSLPGLETVEPPMPPAFGGVAPAAASAGMPQAPGAMSGQQPYGPRQALEAALGGLGGPPAGMSAPASPPLAPPAPNGFMPPQMPFNPAGPTVPMPGQPDPTLAALNLTGASEPTPNGMPAGQAYNPMSSNPTQPMGGMPPSAPPPLGAVPAQPVGGGMFGR